MSRKLSLVGIVGVAGFAAVAGFGIWVNNHRWNTYARNHINDPQRQEEIRHYSGIVNNSCAYDVVIVNKGEVPHLVPSGKSWRDYKYRRDVVASIDCFVPVSRN